RYLLLAGTYSGVPLGPSSDWSGDGIGLLTKEKVQNESDEGASSFVTAGALTAKALGLWFPWRALVREAPPLAFYDCAHFVRNHADVLNGSSDANDVSTPMRRIRSPCRARRTANRL